jgi:hypothetical protein
MRPTISFKAKKDRLGFVLTSSSIGILSKRLYVAHVLDCDKLIDAARSLSAGSRVNEPSALLR